MYSDTDQKRISGEVPIKLYNEFKELCRSKKKKVNVMLQIGLKEWLNDDRRE